METTEARALLGRSENEIEVRYSANSDEYAAIAERLSQPSDVPPMLWVEALAEAAEAQLIGFHRHDDEAEKIGEDLTILYKPLEAARKIANENYLRTRWESDGRGEYKQAKARKLYDEDRWTSRDMLRATAQQVGVYTLSITDQESITRTYYVAGQPEIEEFRLYIEANGGRYLAHEIVLFAVRDHYRAIGMNNADATKAALDRSRRRIEMHEALWLQRCKERNYEWKRILAVDECKHNQNEHTSECFLRMADLIECTPDAYLSPHIVFIRARVVRVLRQWASRDPQNQNAINAFKMAVFFGPIGRSMIASAIADVTEKSQG